MLATVRQLKQEVELMATQSDNPEDTEKEDKALHELTAAMCSEFQENLNLVRCAVHTLQLAILDVVDKSNAMVKTVTEIAKKCKQVKYNLSFVKVTYPPVWGQTRWCGIFDMCNHFLEYEQFFKQLANQFPELDLGDAWDFVQNYVEAFKPLYICTKNMQTKHVSLADFYLQWLNVIKEMRKIPQNPFSTELDEALINRLRNLRRSRAFQMALYLDPRFNYKGSTIFKPDEKELIQGYIIDTCNRIRAYQESKSAALETSTLTNEDDLDVFITEMYGECDAPPDETNGSRFLHQLKALDVEPRQTHGYDVWQHWVNRRDTHPELYSVAKVVLAVPSNQVSVERAFSALPLVLTDRRSGLGEDTLENILLVKLNGEMFDDVSNALFLAPSSSETL
ncbi:zinc finger BED domain-containing protein 4-like [Armigeres subalbatus]|uniref:zinc finger BED domain-containing protein 4-like n=1 Tax=Armigeres subalbatus TaxID=124917 RepID=UPI002ED1E241